MAGRSAVGPLLNADQFRAANFRVEDVVGRLALDILVPQSQAPVAGAPPRSSSSAAGIPTDAATSCQRLLEQYQRADRDLVRLQSSVESQAEAAHADVARCHHAFEAAVVAVESSVEAMQNRFQSLDRHLGSAAQVATRIGDRLQTADTFRERATDAANTLRHLKAFSTTADFSDLDDLFREPDQLEAAADMTGRMQILAQELTAAKARARSEAVDNLQPQLGSIEYAAVKLEGFRQLLEVTIVSRFDVAVSKREVAEMQRCASIMSHFPRGATTLVNRYISSRPMFMDAKGAMGQATMRRDDNESSGALHRLSAQLKAIGDAVTREAPTLERIFPPSASALPAFVTRLFEQRLKMEVDSLLVVPPAEAPPQALEAYLDLLAQAYRLTRDLATKLQPVVGPNCIIADLTDAVFSEVLGEYLDLELAWLQQLFDTRAATAAARGGPLLLSLPLVTELFAWNHKAVQRSAIMCSESDRPPMVRALFHNSTADCASAGCLLEQVATHVIGALAAANEAARLSSMKAFQPPPSMRNAAMLNKAVTPVVADSVGRVLSAVSAAASVSGLLQQHYTAVVAPAVEPSSVETATCAAGLAALTRAVEGRASAALSDALSDLADQVDKTLVAEQKKSDFQVKANTKAALELEKPTEAAVLATAMLRAATRVAGTHIHGANLTSFLGQLGRAVHQVLTAHMQRYTFSATGALRWKRDLSEYTEWARALRLPLLTDRFLELQELANVLVVAPSALLGLVDGNLRMGHKAALTFIRLRDDFKSARIAPSSMTLSQQFADE